MREIISSTFSTVVRKGFSHVVMVKQAKVNMAKAVKRHSRFCVSSRSSTPKMVRRPMAHDSYMYARLSSEEHGTEGTGQRHSTAR